MNAFPVTVVDFAAAVRSGEVDPLAPARRSLTALRGSDLNAAITVLAGLPPEVPDGPLTGVPVLVKDLIDVAGIRTTYGSYIFRDHVPATTAEAVRRLREAGAIVVGKANLHEFAWGVSSQNPHWGHVVNPRTRVLSPGGSSGGNAAALAAGIVPAGLGTDTAGSVRIPAACCGVVGFKPSNGTVPTTGVYPLAPTLDCVGPMARTARDCALLYSVLADAPVPAGDPRRLRVAATTAPLAERLTAASLPAIVRAQPRPPDVCSAILNWEAWQTHRDMVSRVPDQYDPNVLTKLRVAARTTKQEYDDALHAVAELRSTVDSHRDYDVLVTPTLPVPVPPADFDEIAGREALGRNTRWVNLLGWAAIALGNVQITGPRDADVLDAAVALEARGSNPWTAD